jgi:hypothetical protein
MCPNKDLLYTGITEKLFNKKTNEEKGKLLTKKRILMQQENRIEQNIPSEPSIKRVLANSGYSETIADKILKLYNPPEIDYSKFKKE